MADDEECLDVRGLLCPLPVLRAQRAVQGMTAGSRLRILATDPGSLADVRHFCRAHGHRLLGQDTQADGTIRHLVEVATAASEPTDSRTKTQQSSEDRSGAKA